MLSYRITAVRTTDGKATELVNAFRAFDKCHVSGIEVECFPCLYTDLGIPCMAAREVRKTYLKSLRSRTSTRASFFCYYPNPAAGSATIRVGGYSCRLHAELPPIHMIEGNRGDM